MYDAKNFEEPTECKDCIRGDCIGDRAYFTQIQHGCMFEFKTAHVPVENVIK